MKMAIKNPNSEWVLDKIAEDYTKHTSLEIIKNFDMADIIWCVDVFSVESILKFKGIKIVSFHHLNKENIHEYNFNVLNKADYFIVPNEITKRDIMPYIFKPIVKLPYWILSNMMNISNSNDTKYFKSKICPNNELLIGSFVKDGNGRVGDSPKVSKNPDLFLEIVDKLKTLNIKILLAGYAREYIIRKLEKLDIPYVYYPKYKDIGLLYDSLDWYLVTSKYEGGPQSIIEASYRGVKILSTNVGMAPEVLHQECICYNCEDFIYKIKNNVGHLDYNKNIAITNYIPNVVIPKYDQLFNEIFINSMEKK